MKSSQRKDVIMDLLMQTGTVTVDALAARFDVSRMTIHRDLDELETSGFLRKIRGGATAQSSSQFESDFRFREKLAAEEKQRIAIAAAAMVEPGQTIIVDDSSSAGAMAPHLVDLAPLTVISNNLAVIELLSASAGIKLIALGGQYSRKFNGFFGLVTEEALRALRADIAFLSSSAIHGAAVFHQEQEVVHTKRLMLAAAERAYLLVDHGKFGRRALHFFTKLDAFDAVLTGDEIDPVQQAAIQEAGIRLNVVGR